MRGPILLHNSLDYNSITVKITDSNFELLPLHSPLLRQSLLVSFPPLTDMLKFSGCSCSAQMSLERDVIWRDDVLGDRPVPSCCFERDHFVCGAEASHCSDYFVQMKGGVCVIPASLRV